MAVECQECCQGKASRTQCVQLTALSEAGGPCALAAAQDNGAASNCDGYAPVLLRSMPPLLVEYLGRQDTALAGQQVM